MAHMLGLRGLAELSGSFAVAGFAAAFCKPSRTAHAFYVDPAQVIFRDVPYPVKLSSGNLLIPGGTKVRHLYIYFSTASLTPYALLQLIARQNI